MKFKNLLITSILLCGCLAIAQIAPTIRTPAGCQIANEEITVAGAGKITQINITNNVPAQNVVVMADEYGLYEIATSAAGPFTKSSLTLSGATNTMFARANPVFSNMGENNIYQLAFYNVETPNTKSYFDFYTNVAENLGIANPEMEIVTISSPNLGATNQLQIDQFQSETVTGFIDIKIPTIAGGVTVSAHGTTNDFNFLANGNPNAIKAFQYINISTVVGMDFVSVPANFTLPSNFNGRLNFRAHVPASETVKPYILLFTITGAGLQAKEFSVASGSLLAKVSTTFISGLNNTLNTNPNTALATFEVKSLTISGTGAGNQYTIETANWIGASATLSTNINDYITRPNNNRLSIPNTGGVVYFANISTVTGEFNRETSTQYSIEVRQFVNGGTDFSALVNFSGTTTRPVDFIAILNPIDANLNAEQRINNFNGDRIGTQFYRTLVQGITKNPDGVSNIISLSILGTGIANAITVAGVTADNFNNTEDYGYRVSTSASGTYSESITLPTSGGVAYIRFDATLPTAVLINDNSSVQIFADNNRTMVYFPASVAGMPRILPFGIGSTRISDDGYRTNQKGFGYEIFNSFPSDRIPVNALSFGGENFTGPITLTCGIVNQFSISPVQSISLTETGGYTDQLVVNVGDVVYTKVILGDDNGTPTYEEYSIVATSARNAKTIIDLDFRAGLPSTTPQIVLNTARIDFKNKNVRSGRGGATNLNVAFIDNYATLEIQGYSLPAPITLTGKFFTKVSTSGPTVWSSVAILPASGGLFYVANDKQIVGQYCSEVTFKSGTITGSVLVEDFASVVATLSGVTDQIILPTAIVSGLFTSTILSNIISDVLVSIVGNNFQNGASVTIGGVVLTNVAINGNVITGTIPAGSTITNPSNPTIIVQNPGASASAPVSLAPVIGNPTNVNESLIINNLQLIISPNPSSGTFTIKSNEIFSENEIKVMDVIGTNVSFTLVGNELTISKSGIYFFNFSGKVVKVIVL